MMAFSLKTIIGLLFLVGLSSALKFDLTATTSKSERCIRNFVSNGQLVVVTAIVSGTKGDGQLVNMHVCLLCLGTLVTGLAGVMSSCLGLQIKDAMGNDYGRPKDIVGETRQSFTSPADTAFDVCFENTVTNTRRTPFLTTPAFEEECC